MGKVEFDYPNSITLLRQVIAVMDVRSATSKMRQSIRSKALSRKRILVLLLGFPAFATVLAQTPQGFSPPDERQRADAIGATNSLPKTFAEPSRHRLIFHPSQHLDDPIGSHHTKKPGRPTPNMFAAAQIALEEISRRFTCNRLVSLTRDDHPS